MSNTYARDNPCRIDLPKKPQAFSGSVEAVCPPKSGYPSADTPQLDFECRFLVATATRVEIQSQKGFLQCTIGKVCTKKTKTVVSNFVC